MSTAMFISHARNTEELKAEFCSDIRRRIEQLEGYNRVVARSATEKARTAAAIRELEQMLAFWQAVYIDRPRRGKAAEAFKLLNGDDQFREEP